jgi:Sortase domain
VTTPHPRQLVHNPWRRRLPWLGVTVGLGLIVTAGVGTVTHTPVAPQTGTVPTAQAPPPPWTPATSGEVPHRLVLPILRVDAPIMPVQTLPDGELDVPGDPHLLGWWQDSARPGSVQGSVVIDGHVDTAANGPGALFYLRELHPGDPAVLSTAHGTYRYVVAAVRSYPKAALPTEVFGTAGAPRLVIITCGGAFSQQTRQYSDNIVAYAVPTP